jgi:hypothetical protein
MTNENLGWKGGLIDLRCDRGHDGDWTVAIGNVVLENKGRAGLTDLGPHGRIEGDEEDITPSGRNY